MFVVAAIVLFAMSVLAGSPDSGAVDQRDTEMLRDYEIDTSQEIEREELLLDRQIENLRQQE